MALPNSEQAHLTQKAVDEYEHGNYANAEAAALHFNINPRRVQRQLRGHASRIARAPTNTRLSKAQEQYLCDYYERLDNIKFALDSLSPPAPLGFDWATRFIKRRLKYFKRKQTSLNAERQDVYDEQCIRETSERFRRGISGKGVQFQDIWNMNKTGFRVSCGIAHCVVTLNRRTPLRSVDPDNRDYVTSVEYICTEA